MGWIYYTSISPTSDQTNSFNEAFDIFLNQCQIDQSTLNKQLSTDNCFRFLIKTDPENNKIVCRDNKIYLRSKFLINGNFKRSLIEYYKPMGIFVKGPREIIRRDGTVINKWIIELIPIYSSK